MYFFLILDNFIPLFHDRASLKLGLDKAVLQSMQQQPSSSTSNGVSKCLGDGHVISRQVVHVLNLFNYTTSINSMLPSPNI